MLWWVPAAGWLVHRGRLPWRQQGGGRVCVWRAQASWRLRDKAAGLRDQTVSLQHCKYLQKEQGVLWRGVAWRGVADREGALRWGRWCWRRRSGWRWDDFPCGRPQVSGWVRCGSNTALTQQHQQYTAFEGGCLGCVLPCKRGCGLPPVYIAVLQQHALRCRPRCVLRGCNCSRTFLVSQLCVLCWHQQVLGVVGAHCLWFLLKLSACTGEL
jgi:hypothetical protein